MVSMILLAQHLPQALFHSLPSWGEGEEGGVPPMLEGMGRGQLVILCLALTLAENVTGTRPAGGE